MSHTQCDGGMFGGCRGWEARLGEAGSKWAAEKEAAERRWEDARATAGAAWQAALDRAQAYGAEQLAAAQRRWDQARHLFLSGPPSFIKL